LWDRIIAEYGSYQRGDECFGAIWGVTVFGTGGCPEEQQLQMRAEFGWYAAGPRKHKADPLGSAL
jgi:hypothetical protein